MAKSKKKNTRGRNTQMKLRANQHLRTSSAQQRNNDAAQQGGVVIDDDTVVADTAVVDGDNAPIGDNVGSFEDLTDNERMSLPARRRTRVLRRTADGRITDLEDVPVWSKNLYEAMGAVAGTIFFGLFVVIFWPALIALLSGLSVAIITYGATTVPAVVSRTLGVPVSVLVASTDAFIFSWVMPVLAIIIVFSVVYGWTMVQVLKWGGHVTDRFKRGFMTGHGETPKQNRQRRKREKIERASVSKYTRRKGVMPGSSSVNAPKDA